MSLNMKSLTQALAKTAAVIEKTVQTTVQEVTGPKALQDFELLDQVGSGGPGLVWKLYLGKPRNKVAHAHNPEVCVWILDKKALADTRLRVGLSKAAEDAFLDVIRADASQLLKLRHPGVLRIVQALDESKAAMSMVTEPIFASVANILGNMENVPVVPKELKGLELGELEIKHGLLQLAETLGFLHNNAQLIHRALSPEAVFLTSSGAWKLASFGYAVNIEQAVTSNTYGKFHYPDYDVEDLVMPLQPQLDYTAPELTRNDGAAQTSSDIFSLACVAYHLLSRQPLVQSKNNLRTYTSIALYLGNENFSKIPFDLSEDLRRMLTPDAFSRPSASDFTGSKFFREDLRLRALRFLDHMLERDNMQKTDFLKALSSMWKEFDARVLRYKVLPPLCAELRNVTMLPMVLPMVLTIAESQEKADFESSTLPALLPVLSSATGDSLLLLVKHAGLLTNKVAAPQMVETIVPMLVRAYDDPDARMQEEVLRRTLSIAKHLDYQVVKQSILPRVHNLALKTTVAAVRVNALMCLGELVQRIDKQALKDVLQTLHRCTAVDHSAPTLMCTLGVATSIYKQYGIEFAAENLLPLLTPLLVAQQLNLQQFMKYMSFIKDILRTIEEKRGIKQGDQESFMADGKQDGQTIKTNGSRGAPSNGSTWDADDWKSITKGQKEAISTSKMGNVAMAGTESSIPLASSNLQMRPPLNLEWPMPSAGVSSEPGHSSWIPEKPVRSSTTGKLSAVNQDFSSWIQERPVQSNSTEELHDMEPEDPFANWPPPRSKNLGLGGAFNNAHSMVSQSSQVLSSQSQLSSAPWPSLETNSSSHQTRADPGVPFAASHRESQPSLKLPPPPATGLGKGRGRNPIRPVGQSDTKPSKQAPLMDLLQ